MPGGDCGDGFVLFPAVSVLCASVSELSLFPELFMFPIVVDERNLNRWGKYQDDSGGDDEEKSAGKVWRCSVFR